MQTGIERSAQKKLMNSKLLAMSEHFEFDSARIVAKTATGRVTEFVLKLNAPKRLSNRELLIRANR